VAGVFQWIRSGILGISKIFTGFLRISRLKTKNQGCSEFVDGFP
jgi:hypothetical protein